MENEKRLIDANALKMALCTKEGAEALGHSTVKLARVSAIVNAQPTVDAVEVVRCEKCKNWKGNHSIFNPCLKLSERYKEDCESDFDDSTRFDDFCSYGERKDND